MQSAPFTSCTPRGQRQSGERIVQAAAKQLLAAMKPLVPSESKTLLKSLGIRLKARRKDGVITGVIGPRRKFIREFKGRRRWASKYAHLVEGGRKAFTDKLGRFHGPVNPRPYVTRAFTACKSRMVATMATLLKQELERV
jgi:hypothetical protein